ncbi:MAG: GNAT family N-acetyltransferase [Verrucomicrobiota bacterium]|nr:GNAT family N-acetyltransferase [Verrucomicrobiota bacterium]
MIRPAEADDERYLVEWLLEPGVLRWFPLADLREIEDAARIWMSYAKIQATLTAVYQGVPCGSATIYINSYKKLAHQALFGILVGSQWRGKGIGTELLSQLISLAQERFRLEVLHLEVYEGNPAIRLYQRFGFQQYGFQRHFAKESAEEYLGKIMMEKKLCP